MNCANHPDRERTAFCQNCGKPLCSECIRNMGTSIFCEPCYLTYAAAQNPAQPGAPGYTAVPGYVPGQAAYPPPVGHGIPNPGLAALLGVIPGVGAMYNEQYAKGIVHLIVFAILASVAHDSDIFGLFVFGWMVYMVIEAHHTARARRDGTPLPNPFGLNDIAERLGFGRAWPNAAPYAPFTPNPNPDPSAPGPTPPASGVPPANPYTPPYTYTYVPPVSHWGAPQDAYTYTYNTPPVPPVPPVPPMPPYADPNANLPYQRRFPTGALWLIGLGVFFLLTNSGLFRFPSRYLGPILIIAVGVWIFVRKMTETGLPLENDGTQHYRWRLAHAVNGAFWVVLTGVLWLLHDAGIFSWSHSWPVYMIAVGVLMVFKRTMDGGPGPAPYYPPPGYPAPQPTPTAPPVTSTSLVPTHQDPGPDSNQEGR